jgi:hypothetical protein
MISSLTVGWALFMLACHDGSPFVFKFCFTIFLVSSAALAVLVLMLRQFAVPPFLRVTISGASAFIISAVLVWQLGREAYVRTDPVNDFKRFVMGGPHWDDEDPSNHYNPNTVILPGSVQVVRSKTFDSFDGEGAAVYFKISPDYLEQIIRDDQLLPSTSANELKKIDRWAGWYLWTRAEDLGPSFQLYARDNSGIERWLLATNQAHTRVLFLYLNQN